MALGAFGQMIWLDTERRKSISQSNSPDRNEQFEYIAHQREIFLAEGNPIISVDTKKKEHLGSLYREGSFYVLEGQELVRWDHDFSWLSEGVIIPHGIYDFFQ